MPQEIYIYHGPQEEPQEPQWKRNEHIVADLERMKVGFPGISDLADYAYNHGWDAAIDHIINYFKGIQDVRRSTEAAPSGPGG